MGRPARRELRADVVFPKPCVPTTGCETGSSLAKGRSLTFAFVAFAAMQPSHGHDPLADGCWPQVRRDLDPVTWRCDVQRMQERDALGRQHPAVKVAAAWVLTPMNDWEMSQGDP